MQAYEFLFSANWLLETWIAPATGVTQILILVFTLAFAISAGVSVVISTLGYTPCVWYLYSARPPNPGAEHYHGPWSIAEKCS
jgi:hypothetical protein